MMIINIQLPKSQYLSHYTCKKPNNIFCFLFQILAHSHYLNEHGEPRMMHHPDMAQYSQVSKLRPYPTQEICLISKLRKWDGILATSKYGLLINGSSNLHKEGTRCIVCHLADGSVIRRDKILVLME